MPEPLKEALREAWKADKTLYFYGFSGLQESVSFLEFGEGVENLATRLSAVGVGPGVVVAVMGPTGLKLTQACAAVWSLGATLTVLPTPTRLNNLEQFLAQTWAKLKNSRAGLLVGDADWVSAIAGSGEVSVFSWDDLESLGQSSQVAKADLGGLKPALIQFSSGTTRDPQPILLSADALLLNARAVLSCFPGKASDHSCVSWLPLYHDMGLIGCFLMPLLAPGDLTLMGPEVFAVRPLMWLEAISQQRATTSSAPNFALVHCCDRISDAEIARLDLSCWQIAMVGAETVRPSTLRRFTEKFAAAGFQGRAFSPVYGLAEATLAVTFSPLGEGFKTLSLEPDTLARIGRVEAGEYESTSLGRPLEGVTVEIRKDGMTLDEDRLGEVWVQSPSLMIGTLQDGVVLKIDGNWLSTGDAGFLSDGDLYLYGRRSDILLIDGRNHDPGMLEHAAEDLPEIRRCCAFVAETVGQEKDKLILLCEIKKSWVGDIDGLREAVRSRCATACSLVPGLIFLVKPGCLPVTSSGKLQRGAAAKLYREASLDMLQATEV